MINFQMTDEQKVLQQNVKHRKRLQKTDNDKKR